MGHRKRFAWKPVAKKTLLLGKDFDQVVCAISVGALPELIGHSGVTGSFSFSNPEAGLHIAGTFNQLDKPSRPYGFMSKVAKTAIDHLHG